MPRLPHETLPVGGGGRKSSPTAKKHFTIYALFYILAMEIASTFLAENPNYLTYWFPLLTTIGFSAIFLNLFWLKDKLNFCVRKTICVGFLSFYYLFSSICIIFEVNDSFYTNKINVGFIVVFLITIGLSFKRK